MQPPPPASKPRRPRHLGRWILAAILATFAWSGWKTYDFHLAKKEAEALGWKVESYGPLDSIKFNWRAAFYFKTWKSRYRFLSLSGKPRFDEHLDLLHRLKPDGIIISLAASQQELAALETLGNLSSLTISNSPNLPNIDALKRMKNLDVVLIDGTPQLTNIDALKDLQNLRNLMLWNCPALTNVDALRELKSLESLWLSKCTGLKNVDGLLGLTQLKTLNLSGCTGLSEETLDALKAALPNTKITAPNGNLLTPDAK